MLVQPRRQNMTERLHIQQTRG